MQPGCFSIKLENLFFALLDFGVTNASFIVVRNYLAKVRRNLLILITFL